ncbi:MAG: VWA domain-containing protein [Acidobacteriota bacterium]|nr:VWA domain-containing protein [Acidobacteriota bacterium]
MRRALLAVCALALMAGAPLAARQVFRSGVNLVSVDVSVKAGNTVVAGLTAADFRLYDNGVLQQVDAVSIEAVPIDVTIFHDTSVSQGGRVGSLKKDIITVAGLLRAGDRVRLLTFDDQVQDAFGWQPAGAKPDVSHVKMGRVSPVYDALFAALLHKPDTGRRHMVLALTDAADAGGVISLEQLSAVAERSDAVLHLVILGDSRPEGAQRGVVRQWNPTRAPQSEVAMVERLVTHTGGVVHEEPIFRNHVVSSFRKAFDDFRQSYVLRYTPQGVPRAGWHELKVEVTRPGKLTVRARRGYRE